MRLRGGRGGEEEWGARERARGGDAQCRQCGRFRTRPARDSHRSDPPRAASARPARDPCVGSARRRPARAARPARDSHRSEPRARPARGPNEGTETVSRGGHSVRREAGVEIEGGGGRRRSEGRARERGGGVTHNVGSAEDSGRDRLREPGGGRWSGLESGSEPFPKPLRDSRSREAQRCACGARAACVSVRIKGATRARGEEGRTEPE